MLRSLYALMKLTMLTAPGAAVTADTNGGSLDTKGFGASAIVFMIGAQTFTSSNKIALKLEESDDNTNWSAVADGEIQNQESAGVYKTLVSGSGSQVEVAHYLGYKRYVRGVLDISGTISCVIGIGGLLGKPQAQPPA